MSSGLPSMIPKVGSVDRHEYQVAIICALETECNAVGGIFDELYEIKDTLLQKSNGDRISYTLGRIGRHHVVLAHMPGAGKVNAAITASSIRSTFPNIARGLTLVVGVCGGAPQTSSGQEIYLGDVIVSTGILQADFGRELANSFVAKDHLEGNLGAAPIAIKSFLSKIQTRATHSLLTTKMVAYSAKLITDADTSLPDPLTDKLYPSDYLHKHQSSVSTRCQPCLQNHLEVCLVSQNATCMKLGCHTQNTRFRPATRSIKLPSLYFGLVCSTDAVRRNGLRRDELTTNHNVVAFEMEGAGVWETLPSLVIKALCDYADSHKNKNWQELAAINAAAFSKAILEEWIPMSKDEKAKVLAELSEEEKDQAAQEEVQEQSLEYLKSLDFLQLDSRLYNISFAQPGTCDWIFNAIEFKSWLNKDHLDDHHGILWIRGKPGSGKSVLMKHILQAKHLFGDRTLAAYFFHARGTELQHSITGLYRSLLFQLLSNDANLLDHFVEAFPIRAGRQIEHLKWSISELQHFILLAIRQRWIKQTVLLIDALDECDHNDARELVSFCEDLALNAVEGQSQLLVCLSIRHFPNITMQKCVQINIENHSEHRRDIEKYVYQKSHVPTIAPQICARAQHVFLWVVLVVRMMNDAYDRGIGTQLMLEQLATIPTGLDAIFSAVLQDDQNTSEDPTFMFQLVLYAFRKLSVSEIWLLATMAGQGERHPYFDGLCISDETIWNSILTTSRGLLERTYSTYSTFLPTVQFIHESVRDYLGSASGFKSHYSTASVSYVADCHERIADQCISVLKQAACSNWLKTLTIDSPMWIIKASYALEYPRDHVLDHIAAIQDPIKITNLLENYALWSGSGRQRETVIHSIVRHWDSQRESAAEDARKPHLFQPGPFQPGKPASISAGLTVLNIALVRFESLVPLSFGSREQVLEDVFSIVGDHMMCDALTSYSLLHGIKLVAPHARIPRPQGALYAPHPGSPIHGFHVQCGRDH